MRLFSLPFLLVGLCGFPPLILASDPGTTGANFLKIPVGPRAIAMGEAGVAAVQDVSSVWWNPSGLSNLEAPEATFMYNKWFADITEQFSAFACPSGKWGTLGFSFYKLGTDPFQGYDAQANPVSQVDAGDMSIGMSYAGKKTLGESAALALGFTAKALEEQLAGVRAKAYAFDVGTQCHVFSGLPSWGEQVSLGIGIQNLGTGLTFDQETAPLPRTYRVGASFTGELLSDSYTLALDGVKPVDGNLYSGLGLEYWVRKLLALRVGYRTHQDIGPGVRGGVGFKIHWLQFDYAWTGFAELGNTHRASISVRFSQIREESEGTAGLSEKHYKLGLKYYREGAYARAIIQFNHVLERVPDHEDARQMLKACFKKLNERH